MIDGIYKIAVDVPFGRKDGTVAISTEGDAVIGEIDAPIVGKQRVVGQPEGDDAFTAQGTFKLKLVGKVDYSLRGQVEGDSLRIVISSSKGDFEFVGNRMR